MRRVGLKSDGLGFGIRARINEGKLESEGCTATIVDVGGAATYSFTKRPALRTWLTAAVSDTDTSWPVANSAGYAVNGYYHCGTETVKVTAIPDATHLTVARGQWGTTARAHTLGYGDRLQYLVIGDRPTIMRGRRFTL